MGLTLNILTYSALFFLGALLGSFINAVIYRVHHNLDFIFSRSYCPSCHHKLSFLDMVPILSYIALRGRCRYCNSKVPVIYLLSEVIFGGLTAVVYYLFYSKISFFNFFLIYVASLLFVGLLISDLLYFELPNLFLYSLISLGLIYRLANQLDFLNLVLSISLPLCFFGIQYLLTNGKGIGDGDIWLGVAMGIFLQYPLSLYSIFLSYVIGSIVFLPLFLTKRDRPKVVPLGGLLIPVFLVVLYSTFIFGEDVINHYFLKIFLFFGTFS